MIIVTGGAGFIGSALVWGLNTEGCDNILVVDHLGTTDKWRNLRGLSFSDYMEKGDFLERIILEKGLPDDIEAVIHMGACSSTTEKDASYLVHNNFQYSKELALYCMQRKIRFIYASSAATYGDGSQGYKDKDTDITRLRPLNMYGYSKQLFDLWALKNDVLSHAVGLKFFNVFGPNEYHKGPMRSMVLKAFEQIRDCGTVKLFKSALPDYKDGEQKRDFLYIKDAVTMVLYLLDKPSANGIVNIGSGKAATWNELIEAVFAAMDKKSQITYIDMPEEIKDTYQYFTQADTSTIRSLGYTRQVSSIKDSVSDYCRTYLAQSAHLDNISGK